MLVCRLKHPNTSIFLLLKHKNKELLYYTTIIISIVKILNKLLLKQNLGLNNRK